MSDHYRINVRFDMNKEQEKNAAEYLIKLSECGSQTRNRFIVNAVIEAIRRKESGDVFTLENIRAMFREELKSVSLVAEKPAERNVINTELTKDQQAENDENVLSALAMFG